jgi:ribonuclease R
LRGERTGIRYQLTDRVTVQVSRVDLDARKIDLRLVTEPGIRTILKNEARRADNAQQARSKGGAGAKAGGARKAAPEAAAAPAKGGKAAAKGKTAARSGTAKGAAESERKRPAKGFSRPSKKKR